MTGVLREGTGSGAWDGTLVMEWARVGSQWDGGARQWVGLGG